MSLRSRAAEFEEGSRMVTVAKCRDGAIAEQPIWAWGA